jgi:hypothetical protein
MASHVCPVCGRDEDVHYQAGYCNDVDGVDICEVCVDVSRDRFIEEYNKAREEFDAQFRAQFVDKMIRAQSADDDARDIDDVRFEESRFDYFEMMIVEEAE